MERHCVDVGTSLQVDITKDTVLQLRRPIDYPSWNEVSLVGGGKMYVDDDVAKPGGEYMDVVVDFVPSGFTDSVIPDLEITATPTAKHPAWNALSAYTDGKYHIPQNLVARLGAWDSDYSGADLEQVLARYFWHNRHDSSRTDFFSLQGTSGQSLGLVRTYQYTVAWRTDTVLAQFVHPGDWSPTDITDNSKADYGETLELIVYTHSNFKATISVPDTTIVAGDSVYFDDDGGNGGSATPTRLWTFHLPDPDETSNSKNLWRSYPDAGVDTVVLKKTFTPYHDNIVYEDTTVVTVEALLEVGSLQGAYAGWPSNNEIEEYEDCQWEVSPTGGVGTYSYQWQKSRGPG
jgi:hypothetical protein